MRHFRSGEYRARRILDNVIGGVDICRLVIEFALEGVGKLRGIAVHFDVNALGQYGESYFLVAYELVILVYYGKDLDGIRARVGNACDGQREFDVIENGIVVLVLRLRDAVGVIDGLQIFLRNLRRDDERGARVFFSVGKVHVIVRGHGELTFRYHVGIAHAVTEICNVVYVLDGNSHGVRTAVLGRIGERVSEHRIEYLQFVLARERVLARISFIVYGSCRKRRRFAVVILGEFRLGEYRFKLFLLHGVLHGNELYYIIGALSEGS